MSGCWLWMGAGSRNGYGFFRFNGTTRTAHRAAWEMFRQPVPEGLQIDHLCRVRCCVNPAHLEPVTASENSRRAYRNGRPRESAEDTSRRVTEEMWGPGGKRVAA